MWSGKVNMPSSAQYPNENNSFSQTIFTAFDRRISLGNRSISLREVFVILCAILCISPLVSPPLALVMGLAIAQVVGYPFLQWNQKATRVLLQCSVVGLGFGMNVHTAMQAGHEGIIFAVISILGTLCIGIVLGKVLRIERATSYLISVGTAICGGSAIAAIAPIIRAEEKHISVALGTVFILNSVALLVFPVIGHALHLSPTQFGLWAAIAIHDTSSVVGAASRYGVQALEVATTVKLSRALWIIPLAVLTTVAFRTTQKTISIPYFIGLFIVAMLASTYVDAVRKYSVFAVLIAKAGLTLTLFLIGCGLSRNVLRAVGVKPFLQGVVLWVLISVATLWAVLAFVR
jgi:uncharacterized integral membrane protein (TIGR00698 family)